MELDLTLDTVAVQQALHDLHFIELKGESIQTLNHAPTISELFLVNKHAYIGLTDPSLTLTPTVGLASKGGLGVGALEKRDMEGGRGKGKRWDTSKRVGSRRIKGYNYTTMFLFLQDIIEKGL